MKRSVALLILALVLLPVAGAQQRNREVVKPPKTDLSYLIHADNLLPTEHAQAQEDASKKNQVRFWVAGASSSAKTPLAGPSFLFQGETIDPRSLSLFAFEVRNGQREVLFLQKKKKKSAKPFFTSIHPVGEGVVKIQVDASLAVGEYRLTPEGLNDVFCFSVF